MINHKDPMHQLDTYLKTEAVDITLFSSCHPASYPMASCYFGLKHYQLSQSCQFNRYH